MRAALLGRLRAQRVGLNSESQGTVELRPSTGYSLELIQIDIYASVNELQRADPAGEAVKTIECDRSCIDESVDDGTVIIELNQLEPGQVLIASSFVSHDAGIVAASWGVVLDDHHPSSRSTTRVSGHNGNPQGGHERRCCRHQ